MPDLAARIGWAMMAVGGALILTAELALLPRTLRVRRRSRALRAALEALRQERVEALARLEAERAETRALLAPWRRLRRWSRHSLVVATLEWNRRRRRRRRAGSAGR